jgi:hypothetical protein
MRDGDMETVFSRFVCPSPPRRACLTREKGGPVKGCDRGSEGSWMNGGVSQSTSRSTRGESKVAVAKHGRETHYCSDSHRRRRGDEMFREPYGSGPLETDTYMLLDIGVVH